MASKSRLGKGLGALFPALPGEQSDQSVADVSTNPTTSPNVDSLVAKVSAVTDSLREQQQTSESSGRQPSAQEHRSGRKSPTKRASIPALDSMAHPSDLFFGTTVSAPKGRGTSVDASDAHAGVSRETESPSADGVSRETSKAERQSVSRETGHEENDEGETLRPVNGGYLAELGVDEIKPNAHQPRTIFDEDELRELSDSIREVGVLQPIVVRKSAEGHYELVMGERRWRATKMAGLKEIPAIVKTTADDDMLRDALLENLHRVALNPLEEAAAYQQMIDEFGLTQQSLSKAVSKSRPQIANTLRLLNLPATVQKKVASGVLSAGHARALLALPDEQAMDQLATRIIAEGLSVRSTEEIVSMQLAAAPQQKRRRANTANPWAGSPAQRSLEDRFETKVSIKGTPQHGRIEIVFSSPEDMDRIMKLLIPEQAKADDKHDEGWV